MVDPWRPTVESPDHAADLVELFRRHDQIEMALFPGTQRKLRLPVGIGEVAGEDDRPVELARR